mgnify:CR=1 FL=1
MDLSGKISELEFNKLNELFTLFKKKQYKDGLNISKDYLKKFPNLLNASFTHNLLGLFNFNLHEWNVSIDYFKKAIQLDKNYIEANYNLGLAYFNAGELENSFKQFIFVLNIKKDYMPANQSLIQLLTFYKPKKTEEDNLICLINSELRKIDFTIKYDKKISDVEVIQYYKKCLGIVSKNLNNFLYQNDQIFRRNGFDLNCDRHKGIFNSFNTIPKFCFSCFKVVIETKSIIDLIKLSLVFDKLETVSQFARKCMIDNRSGKLAYKGFIYCSSVNEVLRLEAAIKPNLDKLIGNDIKIVSKRGCSEFAEKYPDYQKVFLKEDQMMPFKSNWSENEKNFDNLTTADGIEKRKQIHKSLSGTSLNDFLIIHKWLKNEKLFI